MIQDEHLDVRTITMGISLLDCCHSDIDTMCGRVYDKITRKAKDLVKTGEQIEKELGIPIINKRISVTPAAMILAACDDRDAVKLAKTLERAACECGVNFLGGFSALVQKGFAPGDRELIEAIPEALSVTEHICSSVNIGSTKAGINMDAVAMMGEVVRRSAELTADRDCIGPAKLVVFCNAPEDNPFMAGAFHGAGEPDCVINVGVSGPGCRPDKEDCFQDHPHGSARCERGFAQARCAVRHSRPLACPDPGDRRFRRSHTGGNGS